MHLQQSLSALRTAIPYIRAYKGRVFVVKLGGQLCVPGRALDNVVDQLGLLYQLGIQLVVVHGGGPQATAMTQRLGLTPQVFAGRRITDAAVLEVAKMTFAGTLNTDLVAALQAVHVPAVGLSGIDAGTISARKRPVQTVNDPSSGEVREIDFGFVGDIGEVRPELLRQLLASGYVPVVCSLAADERGQVLNVNADTVATRIAVALGAAKYFLITNVDGVLRDIKDSTSLLPYLDLAQLDELIAGGAISGGMLPKLTACIDALRGGVPRVHIINGGTPDSLLGEVFTNEGCGTLLVSQRNGRSNGEASATAATTGANA